MRKAERRRLGEEKAKREAADRLASGLAAQKTDQEARLRSEATPKVPSWKTKQAERNEFMEATIKRIAEYNPELAQLLRERYEIQKNHEAFLAKQVS